MAAEPQTRLFDVALPLMYAAPKRSLSTAYFTADGVQRIEEIRQATGGAGATIAMLHTYWDPGHKRIFGTLVLDQTDARGNGQPVADALSKVSGVTILAHDAPHKALVAFEHNRLSVTGVPVSVVASEHLGRNHRRLLETFGDQAAQVLFETGQQAGQSAAKDVPPLADKLGMEVTPAILKQRFSDLQVFGWATVQALRVDDQFTGEALLTETFESGAWDGHTSRPSCHWLRGFLSGVLQTALGAPYQVRETECQAKGDRHCRFSFER